MYQAYADYYDMMDLAEELVTRCVLAIHGSLTVNYQVSICSDLILIFY